MRQAHFDAEEVMVILREHKARLKQQIKVRSHAIENIHLIVIAITNSCEREALVLTTKREYLVSLLEFSHRVAGDVRVFRLIESGDLGGGEMACMREEKKTERDDETTPLPRRGCTYPMQGSTHESTSTCQVLKEAHSASSWQQRSPTQTPPT